jgi:hypothetical protein
VASTMPSAEYIQRVQRTEDDAALLSIILHALADLLEHDLTRAQQALVLEATKAGLELRKRNHARRRSISDGAQREC